MENNITVYQLSNEFLNVLEQHTLMVITIFFTIISSLLLVTSIYYDLKNYLDKNSESEALMKKKRLKKAKRLKKIRKIAVKRKKPKGKIKQRWLVVADSVIGKGHTESVPPLPCQDSHIVKHINQKWGIAVVADGLGSKPKSHIGSKLVSERIAVHLKNSMKKWIKKNRIPSSKEWDKMALMALYQTYRDIVLFAQKNSYEISHLGTTVIAVVFSPLGLLVTHMGDGRAGYRGLDGEWKAMLTPINGEEATQVMPITSPIWQSIESVKPYIESRVIDEPIEAFTLMSDGCESFCYQTQSWNQEQNICDTINLPHKGFFDPVVEKLKYFVSNKTSKQEINLIWREFLESGNQKIKDEPDDKTLIVGVLIN